jgi:Na+/H+-translocating membrane pyrophosphatase
MKSTAWPVLSVCLAIWTAFHLGGLYGIAIAATSMLSMAGIVVALDAYGPITDNAGGIVEMSHQDRNVREITDRLDAVGNVTKANTKGYSVGSASLACFLMFSAYLDEVEMLTGMEFRHIDIAVPEIFVGGLLGSMTVFVFSSWAIAAVGVAAEEVIEEVRKQFREHPGILTYEEKPDYKQCVALVNQAGLK